MPPPVSSAGHTSGQGEEPQEDGTDDRGCALAIRPPTTIHDGEGSRRREQQLVESRVTAVLRSAVVPQGTCQYPQPVGRRPLPG